MVAKLWEPRQTGDSMTPTPDGNETNQAQSAARSRQSGGTPENKKARTVS
jgi:hypothetical protein